MPTFHRFVCGANFIVSPASLGRFISELLALRSNSLISEQGSGPERESKGDFLTEDDQKDVVSVKWIHDKMCAEQYDCIYAEEETRISYIIKKDGKPAGNESILMVSTDRDCPAITLLSH